MLISNGDDDAENNGPASCNARVGEPVNVTNGNMYLQQSDYQLPGAGEPLQVVRTYNSNSQRTGLFGRGWSTAYDESIEVSAVDLIRLHLPDGRAVNFRRASSGGAFAPQEADFHGAITLSAGGSYTLNLSDGGVHRFSAAGRLISLADRNNNQTVLAYDANGHLSSVTDPAGRSLTLTTNASGRVTQLNDASGVIATYAYGASDELVSVTYPDGSLFRFAYTTSPHLVLTTVTDALVNVLESHTYDAQGRALTSERDGGVERYTLAYVSATETEVTDARGQVTRFFFDKTRGRNVVTRVEGACGCGGGAQVQTWEYDAGLNVTRRVDALNRATDYTYDAAGNRLTETTALGTATFTYNPFGQVLTATDAMSGVTTFSYDARGNLLSARDALNNETTFTYDTRGLLTTVTDARNGITRFEYDTAGQMTRSIDALGHATVVTYDGRGRVVSVTDAANNATSVMYDAAGRVATVTAPGNAVTTFTYDQAGQRTRVRDARGQETTFTYDGAGRLITVTDATENTISYTYDLMSSVTEVTDALGRTTNYEYDGFNRLVRVVHPEAGAGAGRLEEQFEYDAAGNLTARTDEAGRVTRFAYDSSNRLTSTTDATQQTTHYEYNARSQMPAVVDASGERHEFSFDALGRMTEMRRGGTSATFAYDAAGNRTRRTDYNGATTIYQYDAVNRLTTVSYPNSTTVSYAYDAVSRLTSATNQHGAVTASYDVRSRVASVTDVWNQRVSYEYDAVGNRTQMRTPTTTTGYQYDALNRVTQLTSAGGTASFAYDAVSRQTSRSLPNGTTVNHQYDNLDRLTRLSQVRGGQSIADYQYQHNAVNQITQIGEQAGARTFAYDAVNRLTQAVHPNLPPNTEPPQQPCPPTGQQLANDPVVIQALQQAWRESRIGTREGVRREQGGWIYARNGRIITRRARPGASASIDLRDPPQIRGALLVGTFHTHPGFASQGFDPSPSPPDINIAFYRGVPGLVISEGMGITPYGPNRRGSNPESALDPNNSPNNVARGYPGNTANTQGCP